MYPSIHDFGLKGPLVMRSRKAGLPFATRAWKRELSIQEVRIENDSDRKFSKSKFFKVFLKTTFLYDSCYPDHYEPKIFFSVLRSGFRTYNLHSEGCRTRCDWFQILIENVTFEYKPKIDYQSVYKKKTFCSEEERKFLWRAAQTWAPYCVNYLGIFMQYLCRIRAG